MRRPGIVAALLILTVPLAVAGCGSSGGTGGGATAAGLLDRLAPQRVPGAVVIDVVALRRGLGLDAHFGGSDPRFRDVLGVAYPVLFSPWRTATTTAIDLGRVTAAASNGPVRDRTGGVTLLATTQPFDEIRKALTDGGYTADGDVLRAPPDSRVLEASAVAGGSGLVAIGNDATSVLAAAQGHNPGIKGTVRDLVTTLNAPAVAVIAPTGLCQKAIAVTDDLAGRHGRLLVLTDRPDPGKLATAPKNLVSVSAPKVDGDRLTATVTYTEPEGSALDLLGGELSPDAIYGCGT